MKKLLWLVVGWSLCLAAPASATTVGLSFDLWDDGRVEFSEYDFFASQPIDGVSEGDSGADFRELSGIIEVEAGKIRRRSSSWDADGIGHYDYGRATLTLSTDHGDFTASIRRLSFYIDLIDRPDGREILPTDFELTNAKYDKELAAYLGVKRTATTAYWGIYADGFWSNPGTIDGEKTLVSRIYTGGSGFWVDSVLLEPTVPVPEPNMLALMGAAAVLLQQRRRRRR